MPKKSKFTASLLLLTFLAVSCLFGGQQSTPAGTAGVPAGSEQPDAEVLLRDAQNAFNRGDYNGAIRNYEQVVALRPSWAEVLSNLGVAYHFAGRPRDAVTTLTVALKLKPDMAPANLILGYDYVKLGEPSKAIGPLHSVLEKDPQNRDALFALASAHLGMQEYDQAVQAYRREVAARPGDADAWYGIGLSFEQLAEDTSRRLNETGAASPYNQRLLGEMLLEQEAGIDAEEAFLRAIASTPATESEGLEAGVGFARLRLGEMGGAAEQFAAELRHHPGSLDGKLGMAAVALERQDWPSAAQSLCAVAARDMGYFQTRLDFLFASLKDSTAAAAAEALPGMAKPANCGAAMDLLLGSLTSPQSQGPADRAFEAIERSRPGRPLARSVEEAQRAEQAGRYSDCALLLEPFQVETPKEVLLGARCSTLSGLFFKALEAARSVVKVDPQNLEGLYWQAQAARKLAQASFQRAVILNPDSWQGQVLLGDLFRQRKKWDAAISYYHEAAHLKPDSPGPPLGLAIIYWQTGRNPQGEAALKRALEVDPDNHMANFILGDIYIRERRFDDAIPYLEKHLARPPGFLEAHGDLGKAYAALGRNKEAIAELLIASPTDRSGELHFQLSTLYRKEGEVELARKALEESEKLRSRDREDQQRRLERAVGAVESAAPNKP